jgi:RNA polymerase sigma-70 factor (ECF subfamily)
VSFESQLAECMPSLRSFAGSLSRGRDDVDDLVQDTVVRAMEARDGFDGGNMKAWLFVILRNRFCTIRKRESLLKVREDQLSATPCGLWAGERPPQPDSFWSGKDVRDALGSIGPDSRAVLLALLVEGLKYKEAADKLGCPVGTIMSRLHRAKRKLAGAVP